MKKLLLLTISYFLFFTMNAQQWAEIAEEVFPPNQRSWSLKIVDENTIWTCSSIGFSGNTTPLVYRSADGGQTWIHHEFSNENGNIAWDIAPIDSLKAFASVGKLYHTTDGGTSWEVVESYTDDPVYAHFFNANEGWIAGASSDGLLSISVTDDGGATWTYMGGDEWVEPMGTSIPDSISMERPELAYSLMNGSYDIEDGIIIMNMHRGDYWISRDKGYNWERKPTPMSERNETGSVVAIINDSSFMFVGDSDEDYNYIPSFSYFTNDNGETWIEGSPSIYTSSIEYIENTENTILLFGQYDEEEKSGTEISTDFGETWTKISGTRILATDFTDDGRGIGTFSDASQYGDYPENGKVYEWNFDPLTGLLELADEVQISAYPNPTQDAVTIELGDIFNAQNLMINISDLNGRNLINKVLPNESQIQVSLRDIADGVYILTIKDQDKSISKKIIKHNK